MESLFLLTNIAAFLEIIPLHPSDELASRLTVHYKGHFLVEMRRRGE
ncbi:hypothetical protein SLEP1_g2650 [Rubroshorea leprosula]|uniref:Uncharacterized protein n=1 Tax=Rubroshorea leprosula TaxID=152421 RepID=A0AAV5HS22_9ROSI|nr:hypothetical protein SLEP1_g2650 [Rubroshorea leprosula]